MVGAIGRAMGKRMRVVGILPSGGDVAVEGFCITPFYTICERSRRRYGVGFVWIWLPVIGGSAMKPSSRSVVHPP
jgi:hypothetical protein